MVYSNHALCQCVDWGAEDASPAVEHMLRNYEFDHLELEYPSLDQGAEIRLCQIGRCKQCSNIICVGTKLQASELIKDTLSQVYDAAEKRWRWYQEDKNKEFSDVFIRLFQGRDQQIARMWLDMVAAGAPKQSD